VARYRVCAGLAAASALLVAALPEREPHADIHASFSGLLEILDSPEEWPRAYVLWECGLLAALGFGLDLASCAVTGASDDLTHVSPRTGRAVSSAAAAPYRDKLLPLPEFLWRGAAVGPTDIAVGLALTEHFLLHNLLAPQGRGLPEARLRFAQRMRRPTASGMLDR